MRNSLLVKAMPSQSSLLPLNMSASAWAFILTASRSRAAAPSTTVAVGAAPSTVGEVRPRWTCVVGTAAEPRLLLRRRDVRDDMRLARFRPKDVASAVMLARALERTLAMPHVTPSRVMSPGEGVG